MSVATTDDQDDVRVSNKKICPLLTTSSSFAFCEDEHCAWWNIDFGMCALAAVALSLTRPIVREELHRDMYAS